MVRLILDGNKILVDKRIIEWYKITLLLREKKMSVEELESYYSERVNRFKHQVSELKKQVYINSLWRVLVFCSVPVLIYYLNHSTPLILVILLLGISLFLFLVKRQVNLQANLNHHKAMQSLNENELLYLKHDFKHFDAGNDLKQEDHPYCLDIDLFGKGSFFQYINRTKLIPSRKKLAEHLLANNTQGIIDRQQKIKQLFPENNWCQNFLAEASLVKSENSEKEILSWLTIYKPISNKFLAILPYFMGGLFTVGLILLALGIIPESALVLLLVIGLSITAAKVKNINDVAAKMAKAHDLFEQYSKLLKRIEEKDFQCDIASYEISDIKPSQKLNRFSKLLNALNQRNNIMITIFANGFFLRDIWLCTKIDKWVEENRSNVGKWFSILHEYDKYISLGIFAYNHQTSSVFPVLSDSANVTANALLHPLIDPKVGVANDFSIEKAHFNVVTGANMAGKSTFLRTVGLSIVMANSGMPVCSESYEYGPIKLISSMRTSDSLSENESYFFSELKRLKYIVGEISREEHFVILDEILKGTNSRDKAEGSEKFLKKISKSGSSGILATHDLSLCRVAEEIETVHNRFFDAYINNDELTFDYMLREGVCKNMNASFLMEKMGIVS